MFSEIETMTNKKIVTNNFNHTNLLSYFLTLCLFINISSVPVFALEAGNIIDSSGVISTTWGNNTVLNTNNGAVINWNNFNTNADQSITFNQYTNGRLNSMSAVLNRINSGGVPTQFDGTLQANGRVFIINQAGIIFGQGSTINTSQLIASTLDISNSDFVNERYEFLTVGDISGSVVNNGSLTASEGIALIGNRVINTGSINTGPGGFVVMAAGDKVVLNEFKSNIIVEMDSIKLPDGANLSGSGDIINESSGQISAPQGTIVLAAGDIFSTALNLDSKAAIVENGTGRIEQKGIINADAVDGDAGIVSLSAADEVITSTDSITTANAGTNGNGGDVILYSQGTTVVEKGSVLEAKGGAESGNGGFIEVSGKHFILAGDIDASAAKGRLGAFLLDPEDVTITDGTNSGLPDTWYEEDIEYYSKHGTNVIVEADNSITVGDIDDDEISGGIGSITLSTYGDDSSITFDDKNDSITTTRGDITIETGGGGADIGSLITAKGLTDPRVTPGGISVTTTNGGNITAENLSIETGWGQAEIYVDASGELLINGNVTVGKPASPIVNVTYGDSADAVVNLNAQGNITLNGDIGVYAGPQKCFYSSYSSTYKQSSISYYEPSSGPQVSILCCEPTPDPPISVLCCEPGYDAKASILINAGDYGIPGGVVQINGNLTVQVDAGKYNKATAIISVNAIGPYDDNINFGTYAEAPRADADDAHIQSYQSAVNIICDDMAKIKIMSKMTDYTPPPPPPPPPPPTDDEDDDNGDSSEPETFTLLAAPIPDEPEIGFSGCPALLEWAANEIGVDKSDLQVWMSYSLASSRTTQPCESCAKLKEAATVLQDTEGTHIAALAQVINEFALSTAPPSGEQMAMIADAIANNIDSGRHYAMAGEYLDALSEYVGILSNEMNFSREDSIMYAADNYLLPIDDIENGVVADFLAARLAALGG